MNRLFDHHDSAAKIGDRRIASNLLPEFLKRREAFEVLVAIEGDDVVPAAIASNNRLQSSKAGHVLPGIARKFDFESAQAVSADAAFQIVRQPVIHTILFADIGRRQRIGQANRMADENGGPRLCGKKIPGRGILQFGINLAEIQAEPILSYQPTERPVQGTAQTIQHRTFNKADTQVRQKRRNRAGRDAFHRVPNIC